MNPDKIKSCKNSPIYIPLLLGAYTKLKCKLTEVSGLYTGCFSGIIIHFELSE